MEELNDNVLEFQDFKFFWIYQSGKSRHFLSPWFNILSEARILFLM